MMLQFIDDEAGFRREVRAWLARTVPTDWDEHLHRGTAEDFEASQRWWMAELNKVGLGTPHWPPQYGGVDLSLRLQIVLAEEIARAGAPSRSMFQISLNHVPATLLKWGTEYQKAKYLPDVARGVVWCQGFSEPGAGSDLASLKTRAEPCGDHYRINGQKIWSSYSMFAKQAILLARTDVDAPKHAGITYFILDMQADGVEVRPIVQANGQAKFAEIFLTDVRIPVEDRVGEENQGWAVAQTTLSAERGVLSFEQAERLRRVLERFHRQSVAHDAGWLQDAELRRRFMKLFGRMQATRCLIRDLLNQEESSAHAGAITSAHIKIMASTLRKDVGDFLVKVGGMDGQHDHGGMDELSDGPMFVYLSAFAGMIGGGTNEIMRNIIAERGLGMPR